MSRNFHRTFPTMFKLGAGVAILFMLSNGQLSHASLAPDTGSQGIDNRMDLVVGVPYEDRSNEDAGVIGVIYGSTSGLTSTGNQMWMQGSEGIIGADEEGDQFGSAMASGDFNGDGKADLAVSAMGENNGNGVIHIIWGRTGGLDDIDNMVIDEGDLFPTTETGQQFGQALAVGNFDGDRFDDLVIGVPKRDVTVDGTLYTDAGVVYVLYGSHNGLVTSTYAYLRQGLSGIAGAPEAGDNFGFSLAVGDFDSDRISDLAVGVPYEDYNGDAEAGVVQVFYGTPGGLGVVDAKLWSQDTGTIENQTDADDLFGYALAAGDFDGDGHDDLAVGVPNEDLGATVNAGLVNIIFSDGTLLSDVDNWQFSQNRDDIGDTGEANDYFGLSLASADFDGDGDDDLAIGSPLEDLSVNDQAGLVHILDGKPRPLDGIGSQMLSNGEYGSWFGYALAAGDFNGDGYFDLAVGAPGYDINSLVAAGAVFEYQGWSSGLAIRGIDPWSQANLIGEVEVSDSFGVPLTVLRVWNYSICIPVVLRK